jgi:basic membrane lipoprotein Med (substrate-binding protein (PBP1-ABC) superfamily)
VRIRGSAVAMFAGLSVLVAACGSNGPSGSPSSVASSAASSGPSASASAAARSELQVSVVTDVGTDNDKDFNELAVAGTQDGADAIGADPPPVIVPPSASLYAPLIQALVDQHFDIVVATGVNLVPATAAAAKANPKIWFIGVDHAPCIDATGVYDPSSKDCSGDIAKLLPNYIAIDYAEDQAGYLAGIVAASATKSKIIGAIGGVSVCGPCVRYMQGYVLGAKSVDPSIKVETSFVSATDLKVGFDDQAAGKAFAAQFLKEHAGIDVVFQVAGLTGAGNLTGKGIIDAVCATGISVIGVDVDQHERYPASQGCILTSAEKHLSASVSDSIVRISSDTAKGGLTLFSATNDGIGLSPFYDAANKLPADIQTKIDAAISRMKVGAVVTCAPGPECGQTPVPKIGD